MRMAAENQALSGSMAQIWPSQSGAAYLGLRPQGYPNFLTEKHPLRADPSEPFFADIAGV